MPRNSSITLLCEDKTFIIPSEWAPRWGFLVDLFASLSEDETVANVPIPWVYTDAEELRTWIRLNENMTSAKKTKMPLSVLVRSGRRIFMSSIWGIVGFMRPTDHNWSIHTHLDDDIPEKDRKPLYAALGRAIRADGYRFAYAVGRTGKVDDFRLWCDPVYSVSAKRYHFSSLSTFAIGGNGD